ncbi:unnamed protein product [Prunus armeniaca]
MQSVRGWGGGMVLRWVLGGRRRLLRTPIIKHTSISKRAYDSQVRTRPDRPGLDLTSCCSLKQGIGFYPDIQVQVLEQGEDLIWESGIPYTIVRPCALTEELAGADLIFNQGDNIMVYNQIEDHYSLFVVCL